jgi:hypothetical protein
MSMKNSNDTIGNRFRDLPVCSAVPQPTAPPGIPPNCSTFSFPQGHPEAAHIFFFVFPFILSSLQQSVLEGSS